MIILNTNILHKLNIIYVDTSASSSVESAQQIQPVQPEITASPITSTYVENIGVITDPVQQETETEGTSNQGCQHYRFFSRSTEFRK